MRATIGLVLALMCAGSAAWAQDMAPPKLRQVRVALPADGNAALEARVAAVAARAAWSNQGQPSREELLDILVFISLRDGKGHGA